MAFREHRYSAARGWNRYSFVKHLKRWNGLPSYLQRPDPGDGAYRNELMVQLQCSRHTFEKARELAGVPQRERVPGKTYRYPFTRAECLSIIRHFYIALDRGIINGKKRTMLAKPIATRDDEG